MTTVDRNAASVRLADVSKVFGEVTALEPTSLTIDAGEFLTLLGPSGCGKSTTLSLIAGLEYPSSGRIYVDGQDVTDSPPQRRDVAMVFQSYALYPHLNVYDNIAFPLRLRRRGLGESQVRQMVTATAGTLGIDQLLERVPRQLSGGQRQRVALGRAIVRRPAAFLLDEPLSNLDNQLRVQMRSELKELHSSLQATMIYVTHDQAEAMVLSDRMAVMKDGVVQQVGRPLEVYRNPANTFVASFLGERGMNLIPGRINREDDQSVFTGPEVRVPLPGSYGPRDAALLGIWPEDLTARMGAGTCDIGATIRTVELMGNRTIVKGDTGDAVVSAVAPVDFPAEPGARVSISVIAPTSLRVFDVASGGLLKPERS